MKGNTKVIRMADVLRALHTLNSELYHYEDVSESSFDAAIVAYKELGAKMRAYRKYIEGE